MLFALLRFGPGRKMGVRNGGVERVACVCACTCARACWGWGWGGALAKKGVGNTRKSGFYIERGRDGVRMG